MAKAKKKSKAKRPTPPLGTRGNPNPNAKRAGNFVHHDIYFEADGDPWSIGLWEKIKKLSSRQGKSPSSLIREFCAKGLAKAKIMKPVKKKADTKLKNIEVTRLDKASGQANYRVNIENIQDGDKVSVGASCYFRENGKAKKLFKKFSFVREGQSIKMVE